MSDPEGFANISAQLVFGGLCTWGIGGGGECETTEEDGDGDEGFAGNSVDAGVFVKGPGSTWCEFVVGTSIPGSGVGVFTCDGGTENLIWRRHSSVNTLSSDYTIDARAEGIP